MPFRRFGTVMRSPSTVPRCRTTDSPISWRIWDWTTRPTVTLPNFETSSLQPGNFSCFYSVVPPWPPPPTPHAPGTRLLNYLYHEKMFFLKAQANNNETKNCPASVLHRVRWSNLFKDTVSSPYSGKFSSCSTMLAAGPCSVVKTSP
jgi:hypothetical protein